MKHRTLIVLLALALIPLAASTAAATRGEPQQYALADGDWFGISVAVGAFDAEEDDFYVFWGGKVGGGFEFTVTGDTASGMWQFVGEGLQIIQGESQGQPIEVLAQLTYGGGGAVSGSATTLILNGSTTTTGTIEATAGGSSLTIPHEGDPEPLPTLSMPVFEFCDEAYGDWEVVVVEEFEEAGFAQTGQLFGPVRGVFVATRDREAGFSELAAQVLADAGYAPNEQFVTADIEMPEVLLMRRTLMDDIADLLGRFPDWTFESVAFTIDQANAVLNELRNLSECEQLAIGADNVQRWMNEITFLVNQLVAGLVELNLLSGGIYIDPPAGDGLNTLRGPAPTLGSVPWVLLVHLAGRVGVIGPGAIDTESAAATEAALRESGEAMLAVNLGADGLLERNEHTLRILATGAAMGWTFEVDGETIDPASALAELTG